MKPSELEAAIREKLGDDTVVIRDMTDNGGYGLVRYERTVVTVGATRTATEHVVHRWATKDTAGNDRPFMLYSGAYFEEDGLEPSAESLARDEYREREDRLA